MADAKLRAIVDAVKARLAVPNATGIYNYNTSAAGQVIEQLVPMVPIPSNAVFPHWQVVPLYRGDSAPGPTNNHYYRHGIIAIIGYVAATTGTPDARTDAAMNLFQDGLNALETDFNLGGRIENPLSRFWDINPQEFDGAGKIGQCSWEFHFDFRTVIGTGI